MKIKTRLKFVILCYLIFTFFYAVSALINYRQVQITAAATRNSDAIANKIFDLNILTYDYLLHRTERAKAQWRITYDTIEQLFYSHTYRDAKQRTLLDKIENEHSGIGTLFSRIVTDSENSSIEHVRSNSKELENRLMGQLLLKSQSMASMVFQLDEISREAILAHQKRLIWLSVAFLIILLIVTLMNSFFITRSVIFPVTRLQEGAEVIGTGNLDYKVGTSAKDEIGELSRILDRMSSNLKGVTASRDELNQEVAERRRAEALLKQHAEELQRSNAELEEFAYVVSHDLQEPLRTIQSYSQLFERRYKDELDAKANKFIHYAVDGVNRMQELIDDLLTYSRVGTQGKPFEPTDCEKVLQDSLANLKTIITKRNADITFDPLPVVAGDEIQLGQLFQNLVVNAIKFTEDKSPRIHISAQKAEGEWIFSVRDNGIGIDMKYTDRIFKVFERLHPRDRYGGTGIGLAVCRKIVERHGGKIWVESEPGEGSTFNFSIPTSE